MAVKILRHRKLSAGGYQLIVHLDTSKSDGDGNPDPEFVREFTYAPKPAGMTAADYVQMQIHETKLLLQQELAHESAGTKLATEGADL